MTKKISDMALGEFIAECQEMLERLNQNLQLIEKSSDKKNMLSSIYRDIHTIKGSSQLFGFTLIAQLSHAMESCLDPIRKGISSINSEIIDILLKSLDVLGAHLNSIRTNKQELDDKKSGLTLINALIKVVETAMPEDPGVQIEKISLDSPQTISPSIEHLDREPIKATNLNDGDDHHTQRNEPFKDKKVNESSDAAFGIFEDDSPPNAKPNLLPTAPSVSPEIPPLTASSAPTPATIPAPSKSIAEESQSETIRVNVSILDNLMNLIGELVLIRNQVLEHSRSKDDDQEFTKMSQRLNVLTAELQNEVMKTRMQPIGNVLSKFTRVVRDLGRELGKKIELELYGTETELDKTILEAIKDPLTHIVRNAVDHGIEFPDVRKKSGKPESGRIAVRSYHESGQVIIEVLDDGGGIDRQKVLSHAIKKGVITQENANKLSDWEILHLIFTPGFSTANVVSNISGRGVGMDVVKTNVERIGGIVEIQSQLGQGTQIRLKIPLTLAIVPALLIRSGNHRFAIPQSRLVELIRIETKNDEKDRIEDIQGHKVLRLRNRILPLVDLSEVISGKILGKIETESEILNIAILNADKFQFGMVVSEIVDSTDIVVKPLSQFLKDIIIFSGASIMGDGNIALTLDITGIASCLRTDKSGTSYDQNDTTAKNLVSDHRSEMCEFLTVDVRSRGHFAIPLTIVSRLEEIPRSQLEYSGAQRILRYRDELLPIISLSEFLRLPKIPTAENAQLKLIVVKRGDLLYGIEVEDILDIVSYEAKIDLSIKDRPGILGTLLAEDKVIVIIDVLEVIDRYRENLGHKRSLDDGGPQNAAPKNSISFSSTKNQSYSSAKAKILVIDDSSFFRNHISQILKDAGYSTESACDGKEAIARLEKNSKFDLVLSDIEMPIMDGMELIQKIRQNQNFQNLPVFALTTKFSKKHVEEGLKAGFNQYLEKLNPESLLQQIQNFLDSTEIKEIRNAASN